MRKKTYTIHNAEWLLRYMYRDIHSMVRDLYHLPAAAYVCEYRQLPEKLAYEVDVLIPVEHFLKENYQKKRCVSGNKWRQWGGRHAS